LLLVTWYFSCYINNLNKSIFITKYMAQNIVFSVILLALVIFGQSVKGRHIKYIDENNLVKNEDIVHDKHAGILDTTSAATLSPPILPPSVVGDAPPPSHGVGAFRPTTPGNSPGVGHSIHN
jgi:hypothetical protein